LDDGDAAGREFEGAGDVAIGNDVVVQGLRAGAGADDQHPASAHPGFQLGNPSRIEEGEVGDEVEFQSVEHIAGMNDSDRITGAPKMAV
jgi:hypothetical protein